MKKMKKFLIILLCLLPVWLFTQNVAINSTGVAPNVSSMLDVSSTNSGMLIPRMTTAQRTVIVTPATGLFVYDNTTNSFWYYNGTIWVEFLGGGRAWEVTGNNGILTTNFIGPINNVDFKIRTNNIERMTIETNGYVGIRTTVPNSQLHVNGTAGVTAFRVQNNGSSKFTVASNGGTTIGIFYDTPPTNGLYVHGNTGIGIASPVYKLDVFGNARISTNLGVGVAPSTTFRIYAGSGSAYGIYAYGSTMGGRFMDSNGTSTTYAAYGSWGIYTGQNGYFGGNVGIGTTSPTQKLHVVGNIRFTGALMPNNLAGTTGQVLVSAGSGTSPTWGADLSGIIEISRWYYPPIDINSNTTYTITANIAGVTWNSCCMVNLGGDWVSSPSDDITIHHVEARTGQVRFIVSNNTLWTNYLNMDFLITVIK